MLIMRVCWFPKRHMQINDEFDKVVAWATKNKLEINMAKTKEIVFQRPHPKIYSC